MEGDHAAWLAADGGRLALCVPRGCAGRFLRAAWRGAQWRSLVPWMDRDSARREMWRERRRTALVRCGRCCLAAPRPKRSQRTGPGPRPGRIAARCGTASGAATLCIWARVPNGAVCGASIRPGGHRRAADGHGALGRDGAAVASLADTGGSVLDGRETICWPRRRGRLS